MLDPDPIYNALEALRAEVQAKRDRPTLKWTVDLTLTFTIEAAHPEEAVKLAWEQYPSVETFKSLTVRPQGVYEI